MGLVIAPDLSSLRQYLQDYFEAPLVICVGGVSVILIWWVSGSTTLALTRRSQICSGLLKP